MDGVSRGGDRRANGHPLLSEALNARIMCYERRIT
jgi:hypothetical protein